MSFWRQVDTWIFGYLKVSLYAISCVTGVVRKLLSEIIPPGDVPHRMYKVELLERRWTTWGTNDCFANSMKDAQRLRFPGIIALGFMLFHYVQKRIMTKLMFSYQITEETRPHLCISDHSQSGNTMNRTYPCVYRILERTL